MHFFEGRAFAVRLRVGIDFVERKIVDRVALLVDAIHGFVSELMRQTEADLHALVGVFRQRLRREAFVFRISEIGPIRQRLDRDLRRLELRQALGQVRQFFLLLRRAHVIDLEVVQILPRIAEVKRAEHEHLHRRGRVARFLRGRLRVGAVTPRKTC